MAVGVFGLTERDLPATGIDGVAVWPVIGSSPARKGAGAIARIRRHLAWWSMRLKATEMDDLVLVDPPTWARRSVERRRTRCGLTPARQLPASAVLAGAAGLGAGGVTPPAR
ncbi:MAG: hypothetical protein R2770_09420 [Acidimicrobiales bacterium]|nr:hypothetical protein [Acidimicrobiales bacterium]